MCFYCIIYFNNTQYLPRLQSVVLAQEMVHNKSNSRHFGFLNKILVFIEFLVPKDILKYIFQFKSDKWLYQNGGQSSFTDFLTLIKYHFGEDSLRQAKIFNNKFFSLEGKYGYSKGQFGAIVCLHQRVGLNSLVSKSNFLLSG